MGIAGAIVAGGEASRLGGGKPFVPFAGATLLDAVIARVRPQVDALALNLPAGAVATARTQYDLPIVTDTIPGQAGPLAGIVAALEWARTLNDVTWLASFPCDTPFLPTTLVETLRKAAAGGVPVFAHDGARAQRLCALWPLACLDTLRNGVASGRLRSLYRAHDALGAIHCSIAAPAHAFFNVNTPADLREAARLAQR